MRAFRVHDYGRPADLKLDDLSEPSPGPGELAVEVRAAGINFPDLLVIAGKYQFQPPRPFAPGKEFAGVVRAVGEGVQGFTVGDRVMSQVEYGAFSEIALTLSSQCFKLPDDLPFEAAAAMGIVYQTAWFALLERGQFKPGETVLLLGAAGGVGLASVQLAKALGARVLAGVRWPEQAQLVRDNGADAVIDLSAPDLRDSLRAQVHAATGGHGADVVIDPLGGEVFAAALRAMAWEGRLVVVGFAAGDIPSVKLNYLLVKNIAISGLQWSDYRDRTPDKVAHAQAELFRLWREGGVRPHIMRNVPFEQTREALDLVAGGRLQGKVVVSMGAVA